MKFWRDGCLGRLSLRDRSMNKNLSAKTKPLFWWGGPLVYKNMDLQQSKAASVPSCPLFVFTLFSLCLDVRAVYLLRIVLVSEFQVAVTCTPINYLWNEDSKQQNSFSSTCHLTASHTFYRSQNNCFCKTNIRRQPIFTAQSIWRERACWSVFQQPKTINELSRRPMGLFKDQTCSTNLDSISCFLSIAV